MKNVAVIGLLLATVVSALPRQSGPQDLEKRKDDDCEIEWVTVYAREPEAKKASGTTGQEGAASPSTSGKAATSSGSTSSGSSGSSGNSSAAASQGTYGGSSTSALNLPNLPNGQPPIPLNDDYIHAPEPTDAVPSDALIFTPKKDGVFTPLDFQVWQKQFRMNDNHPASKWMKIKPGSYYYDLAPETKSAEQDANNLDGFNIIIYQQFSDWTLDLRGVTFYMDYTDQNKARRPDDAFYFLQSTGLTVLGGTLWIDQGELFTQARVQSVTGTVEAGDLTATFKVEQGYELAPWRNAGPRNQGCADDSNPDKTVFVDCNFWWVNGYDFSKLDSDRTFTAHLNDLKTSNIQKGFVVSMIAGPDGVPSVMVNEDNGGLKVKGFTTNGGFMSIGVNAGETPPHLDGWYQVNPPPRPGFAPRIRGPGLAFGQIHMLNFNADGAPKSTWVNSFYQNSGNKNNLVSAGQYAEGIM